MQELENKNDFSFQVIYEQVADKDSFETKTHENVTNTLLEIVDNTDKGLTVGLEGGWGSGKSTVVNLFKNKLRDSSEDKTLFFSFDAWAHDGDPLRKIFLESLISEVDHDEEDDWLNSKKKEVSLRKKTVQVKTSKSASKLGKYLSLAALLVPFGAALVSAVDYGNLHLPWDSEAVLNDYMFALGFVFSLAPILVSIYWCFCGDDDKDGNRSWDVFESQSQEDYTQDITEDDERTSIEFERYFREILIYITDKSNKYAFDRVVIVIDNLDRVDPDYAHSIWSTLQTFFQHRSASRSDSDQIWMDKLWFLIPFDREGIKKNWNDQDGNQISTSMSFMEKCFQISVEVPTPVMSGWVGYFRKKVHESYLGWPSHSIEEFIDCYKRCMSSIDSSPTPRQMHSVINRAGVLALHWKGKVSAEAMCIYALSRSKMSEQGLRSGLLSDGLPNNYPNSSNLSELKAEMAGILFGVEPKKGMELLLVPAIKKAIASGDGDQLKELASAHPEAFWIVLRAARSDWMVTTDHNDTYKINAITALSCAFHDLPDSLEEYIDSIGFAYIQSVERWDLSKHSYEKALNYLLDLCVDDLLISELQQKLSDRVRLAFDEINDADFDSDVLVNLHELEKLMVVRDTPINTVRILNLSVDKWSKWLNKCKEAGVSIAIVEPSISTCHELVQLAGFANPSLDVNHINTLIDTYKMFPKIRGWENLLKQIGSWFGNASRQSRPEVYDLALTVLPNSPIKEVIEFKKSVLNPNFWNLANNEDLTLNKALPYLVAISDVEFLTVPHVSKGIKNHFKIELDQEALVEAYAYFEMSNELETIWKIARHKDNILARQLLSEVDSNNLFTVGAIHLQDIPWSDETEIERAVIKLAENGAVEDIFEDIKDDPICYSLTLKWLSLYSMGEVEKSVNALIKDLPREKWTEALEQDNTVLLSCAPVLNHQFSVAWTEYMCSYVSGDIDEISEGSFQNIVALSANVADLDSIRNPKIVEAYFKDPSEDYLNEKEFEILTDSLNLSINKVSQSAIEQKLCTWIEKGFSNRVEWLLGRSFNAKDKATESLFDVVKAKLESADVDSFNLYERLNSQFNLGIESIPEKDDEGKDS